MKVVLKAVPNTLVYQTASRFSRIARSQNDMPSNAQCAPDVGVIGVIMVKVNRQPMI